MMSIVKICSIHGPLTENEVSKEKNSSLKLGYQLRCSQCRRDKDRKYKLNNPDKHKESAGRARKEARFLYREGLSDVEPKANIWQQEDRKKNPEKYLEREAKSRKKQGQLRNTKEVCRRFSLDVSVYYEMLKDQNNVCKICGKEETRKSRTEGKICQLVIDHCHTTGIIRSLLCHHCNAGLGHFMDSPDILHSAIQYLQSHQHKEI